MNIPTNLKRKPVIVSENYGKVDISAKVWRHTGGKWSRQSKELPLHPVLDLAILVCRTSQHFRDTYRFEKLYNSENPTLERTGLQGDAMTAPYAPITKELAKTFNCSARH